MNITPQPSRLPGASLSSSAGSTQPPDGLRPLKGHLIPDGVDAAVAELRAVDQTHGIVARIRGHISLCSATPSLLTPGEDGAFRIPAGPPSSTGPTAICATPLRPTPAVVRSCSPCIVARSAPGSVRA